MPIGFFLPAVRYGSKREKLKVSKSGPLYRCELTSMRRLATSLMGQVHCKDERNRLFDGEIGRTGPFEYPVDEIG